MSCQQKSEIWLGIIINGHPVLAEYFNKEEEEEILKKSLEWKSNLICELQYFLQIVKCLGKNVCRPFHLSYLKIVKKRFVPPPITVIHSTIKG